MQAFVVRSLNAGEAGSLIALLGLQLADGAPLGGMLLNLPPVESAKHAADVIALVKDHVVPELILEPTARGILGVVAACARRLRADAAAAGGAFGARARGFALLMETFLQEAQARPADYAALRESAADLRRRAGRLLQESLTVRNQAPVVAAAHAEEQAAVVAEAEEQAAAED